MADTSRRLLTPSGVVDDGWVTLADDAPLGSGKLLVSLERWQQEPEAILAAADAVGVRLPNTCDVDELDLPGCWQLIALEFPKFTDGRAYSQARLLRERHGYTGELRATGEVLRDQLYYMRRCGFDSFELDPRYTDPAQLLGAFGDFTTAYQPAVVNPVGAAHGRDPRPDAPPDRAQGALLQRGRNPL